MRPDHRPWRDETIVAQGRFVADISAASESRLITDPGEILNVNLAIDDYAAAERDRLVDGTKLDRPRRTSLAD